MKKINRFLLTIMCTLGVSFASVLVIFAKNIGDVEQAVNVSAVNPDRAMLAAGAVLVIGIIIFIRRNGIKG